MTKPDATTSSAKMWGGRFEGDTDPHFRRFNDSLPVDQVLISYDVAGSLAWTDALHDAGVLSQEEASTICAGLREVLESAQANPESLTDADDEDIHGWVERKLIEAIGELGKKLHTGRSRNDQVATDFRLFARDAIRSRQSEIRSLQRQLVELAEREQHTIMPGYTHLQRAQPVPLAHWCLAYVEMLERDDERFEDAFRRTNTCPLGSGALAGSSFPIDRHRLAASLGFDRPTKNSLDAVSDRDFVLDSLYASAACSLHLSRMAEDLIIYMSSEFGFVEMSDAVTSGSSLMPQKKNPDAMELIRGKTGRMFGELAALMMTIKASPLAYNKDFQEDKPPLFRAMEELSMCLRMSERVVRDMRARPEITRRAAEGGYANATAFANYLVAKGVPFRAAHEMTGRVVRQAIEQGVPLEGLSLDVLREHHASIDKDVYDAISLDTILEACDVYGGASPRRVNEALYAAKKRLGTDSIDTSGEPA